MLLFLIVVLAAIMFEYSNGFHDAANAIATVVSTKVLTPRQAIAMTSALSPDNSTLIQMILPTASQNDGVCMSA